MLQQKKTVQESLKHSGIGAGIDIVFYLFILV